MQKKNDTDAAATDTAENQQPEGFRDAPKDQLDKILRHHIYASMAVGLIPIPLADFAGLTLVQLNLLRKIAKSYNVRFFNDTVKNILSSLVGGAVPTAVAAPLGISIAKTVPAAGMAAGVVTMPILAGASTYAIGKVFIQHFASGGTFLTFDPEQVKAFYEEMFKEGKEVAAEMKS